MVLREGLNDGKYFCTVCRRRKGRSEEDKRRKVTGKKGLQRILSRTNTHEGTALKSIGGFNIGGRNEVSF